MEVKIDGTEQSNDGSRFEENISDNPPKVEAKTSSLRKILVGVLVGALVGLVVVGIIAAALIFAYGTAGVGLLVLGLFSGISAIAAWSSVAAIGVGIVGFFTAIGAGIGRLFSSSSEPEYLIINPLADSTNPLSRLGGKTHQAENEIKPEDGLAQIKNKILSINQYFKITIRNNHTDTIPAIRINTLFDIIDRIVTFDDVTKITNQMDALEKSVKTLKNDDAYKKDILGYIRRVRQAINPAHQDESNDESNDNNEIPENAGPSFK